MKHSVLHLRLGRRFEHQTYCGREASDRTAMRDPVAFAGSARACKNCLRMLQREEQRKAQAYQDLIGT